MLSNVLKHLNQYHFDYYTNNVWKEIIISITLEYEQQNEMWLKENINLFKKFIASYVESAVHHIENNPNYDKICSIINYYDIPVFKISELSICNNNKNNYLYFLLKLKNLKLPSSSLKCLWKIFSKKIK